MLYVRREVRRLRTSEPHVRTDRPEGVHQMRVALRRLRSALASYRPLFEPSITEPLRAELAWLSGVLGPARDLEVLRAHVADRLEADGHGDMLLRAQVDHQLGAQRDAAVAEVCAVLDGARYRRLRRALDQFVAAPPTTTAAGAKASSALPRRVAKSWRLLKAAVQDAQEIGLDEATRRQRLHEARKKAKRARYAAEVARPRSDRSAKEFLRAMKRVQTALGHTQDGALSVVEYERLAPAVDNAFALGRAHVLEEQRIAAQVGAFDAVWKAASRRKLRRWLR